MRPSKRIWNKYLYKWNTFYSFILCNIVLILLLQSLFSEWKRKLLWKRCFGNKRRIINIHEMIALCVSCRLHSLIIIIIVFVQTTTNNLLMNLLTVMPINANRNGTILNKRSRLRKGSSGKTTCKLEIHRSRWNKIRSIALSGSPRWFIMIWRNKLININEEIRGKYTVKNCASIWSIKIFLCHHVLISTSM